MIGKHIIAVDVDGTIHNCGVVTDYKDLNGTVTLTTQAQMPFEPLHFNREDPW